MYTKKLYLSGGNFHELQAVYDGLRGIVAVTTGYINPASQPVSYDQVADGKLAAVMGICVEYNPKKIDVSSLLDILFSVADPYSPDRQGPLEGPMYGCGVYYDTVEDLPQIQLHLNFMANRGTPPAVDGCGLTVNDPVSDQKQRRQLFVKAEVLKEFVAAGEEHQNYLAKHPGEATHIDIGRFREYIR